MCTVTFLALDDKLYLTSNRDEAAARKTAAAPTIVHFNSGNILFPKDGEAGGTWVAVHENGNAMVLLNGAFVKHAHTPPYRKSRGLIFLDVFNNDNPTDAFDKINLINIEPFTLIIWQSNQLWECRWDGTTKYIKPKPLNMPHIWSSATLYNDAVRTKRETWFYNWLNSQTKITAESIIEFHEFGGDGDKATDLKMNRNGILLTVSITAITIDGANAAMYHKNMQDGTTTITNLTIK